MEIIIKEPSLEIGERYIITVNETNEKFIGENTGFLIFDNIVIHKGSRQLIEAKRRFRPFRKRIFDIKYNNVVGQFTQLTRFKPHYEITIGDTRYEIVQHLGKKVSIFKDSIQVASIVQLNNISFNSNDIFQLLVDNNIDFIPLILVSIILDAPNNGGSANNLVTIDIGNVTGENRPFDKTWKPKTV